jgi:Recombinase zinc beta ribbon domain
VPVPDSGIPTEWVDAAREAIASKARTSKNGGRFWELSGGILRCGGCGWAMKTTTVKAGNSEKRNHYYRCVKHDNRHSECPNRKCHRGERVESQVWEAVSGILKDPEQLRADLDAMIEMERSEPREAGHGPRQEMPRHGPTSGDRRVGRPGGECSLPEVTGDRMQRFLSHSRGEAKRQGAGIGELFSRWPVRRSAA